jgi:hypothetical protein
MPKRRLADDQARLASDIIDTLLAGHRQYRPDLPYPQSHSDMDGAVRGLLEMYEVKRRPLSQPLRYADEESA